jgi:hypothetical protein
MDTPALTPAKALDILTQASGKCPGTRDDHQLIVNAIQVLAKAIAPPEPIPASPSA